MNMNKLLIALGITFAASTGAFAASSALDAYQAPAANGAATLVGLRRRQ
jgi:ABC-type amino acid transport system permease subunit